MPVNVLGGDLNFSASIDESSFEATLQRIENQLKGLTQTANQEASAIENVAAKASLAIGSYLSINAAQNFISQIIKVRGEFESLGIAFEAMLGSKEKADKLMQEAIQLAATTPFSLQDVAQGSKQLLAYGFEADKVTKTLKMLGDVAAGTGVPLADLTYTFGTAAVQGRLFTRDILQFTGRGIPIVEELAKQFGTTKDKVQQLVEAGAVGFPEVQKAFEAMTGAGGKFYDLTNKLAESTTGKISNLGDAFSRMLNDIGADNQGVINATISGLSSLVTNYQTVIDVIKVLVATYGAYRAALLVNTIATTGATIAETLHYGALVIAEKAQALLNKTMLANPYVAVATVVAGLSFALYELRDSSTAVEKATKDLREEEEKATNQKQALLNKSNDLLSVINSETATRYAQLEAFKELQRLYPSVLNSLDLQKFKTLDAKDAQKQFNAVIEATDLSRKEKEYVTLQTRIEQLSESQKRAASGNVGLFAGSNNSRELDVDIEKAKQLKKSIDDVKQAQFEANASPAQLLTYYENAKKSLEEQRSKVEQTLILSKQAGHEFIGWKDTIQQTTLSTLNKQIEDIAAKLKGLTSAAAAPKTNKELIDATKSIDALKAVRTQILADYDKEIDASRRSQLAKDLKYADARTKLLDVYNTDNKAAKEREGIENKISTILEQRQGILEKLAGLQRDAKQSGLLQDDSQIDKIRQKYDEAFKSIDDYNKKIDEFNQKNKTNLKGIGLADVANLRSTEALEIANTEYKQDSANYLASLDAKKKAFDDFEKVQATGNDDVIAYAQNTYKDQLNGFTSYIDFLKAEAAKIQIKIAFAKPNIGDLQSLLAINKLIVTEQNKNDADRFAKQQKEFTDAYNATVTYTGKVKQADDTYNRQKAALQKFYSDQELKDRIKLLDESRTASVDAAKDEVFQKTAIYRQLNEEVIKLSRQQVKAQIDAVQTVLTKSANLPPELRQQLQDNLNKLQSSLNFSADINYLNRLKEQKQLVEKALASGKLSTEEYEKQLALITEINGKLKDQTAQKLQNISNGLGEISGAFSNLSSSIAPFDEGLSATLETVSDITKTLGDAAGAAASFASGDIIGGITKTITTIADVFNIAGKSRESERKANEELKTFQDSLITGAISYNELLRERIRSQGDLTALTVQELQARQQMLDLQKQQAQADYDTLLKKINDVGNQVIGEHTEQFGGFLGIGKKTRTVQDLAGLSGADFDQLEKLFTEGKLDDATAKWFSELQKAKNELDSIGVSAEDAAAQLNQVLTGTTANALADSIAQGLSDGKRSAMDFGDDLNSILSNAILSAFEANQIKPATQKILDQLAAANSDGLLDQGEIDQITEAYNSTVTSLASQFDQIKQIADLSSNNSANTLAGAVKGITEQSAELLAGQFGGIRISNLEILNVATQQLNQLNAIASNTAYLISVDARLRNMDTLGIKVRS